MSTFTPQLLNSPEEFTAVLEENVAKGVLDLVEVYAEWCGPSTAPLATIRQLKDDYEGKKLRFYQVCAGHNAMFSKYELDSRPHFCFFVNGELIETIPGVNAPALKHQVKAHIPEGDLEEEETTAAAADEDEEED